MKKKITILIMLIGLRVFADNPVITTSFTPDPAPYVYNDTVYLFTGHDEDDALIFKMKDWQLFSSTDMINWTYRGTPLSLSTFKWAKQGNGAWASQAVCRNGKWYWYVCVEMPDGSGNAIGVAVADTPAGPYVDILGHPLTPIKWGYIDPSIFVDDDGSVWLFWGNNGCWYAELNNDMVSLKSEVMEVPGLNDESAFGPLVMKTDYGTMQPMLKTNFEEGPWVTKRNDKYYLIYAAGGVPEFMAYSTADNIHGPWTYGGRIMDEAQRSFTIHGGIIDWRGRSFMVYHNGLALNGGGFHRSTSVEEFTWNNNGSLPFIPFTDGVRWTDIYVNPYNKVEAETMSNSYGIKTNRSDMAPYYVTKIDNGDWIKVSNVDFGETSPNTFTVSIADIAPGTSIEIFADRLGGQRLACINLTCDKENGKFSKVTTKVINKIIGVHDVVLLFRGGDEELCKFDYWQFGH